MMTSSTFLLESTGMNLEEVKDVVRRNDRLRVALSSRLDMQDQNLLLLLN